MTRFTLSAAARVCGCDRRTLQRAVQAGRLTLDAQHCLSREALVAAGYLDATMSQDTPHITPQDEPQVIDRLDRIEAVLRQLVDQVERLEGCLTPHRAPQDTPQVQPHVAHTPQGRPQDTPQRTPQRPAPAEGVTATVPGTGPVPAPFDATKYRLGKLCPRGHAYRDTGHSLRTNSVAGYCLRCNAEDVRARRAARRQREGRP